MSDRGYRDEIGAAIERLERLQEENAELRAELCRLDAPRRRAARARSAGVWVVLWGAIFAMAAGAFSHGLACPHRSTHRHSFSPQRTQRSIDVRSRAMAPELTNVQGADDCSIPYFYDRNNVKRYKASCVVDRIE